MSNIPAGGDPPSYPLPEPPNRRPLRPSRRGRGSVIGGLLAGIAALTFLGWASLALASVNGAPGFLGLALFIAYLAAAIVLAVRPRTTRFGAGLLLAIGAWILLGAGLCVALIVGTGG